MKLKEDSTNMEVMRIRRSTVTVLSDKYRWGERMIVFFTVPVVKN